MRNSISLLFVFLPALALLGGCAGYQIGNQSLYPVNIRTVYVPMFQSASFRPYLGERLTEAVMKEIELKTPFKVVSDPNADSTLSGRIVGEGKEVLIGSRWWVGPIGRADCSANQGPSPCPTNSSMSKAPATSRPKPASPSKRPSKRPSSAWPRRLFP